MNEVLVTYLDIEQGVRVKFDSHSALDECGKSLLVCSFHIHPFLLECRIIGMFEETFQLIQILQPFGLVSA